MDEELIWQQTQDVIKDAIAGIVFEEDSFTLFNCVI